MSGAYEDLGAHVEVRGLLGGSPRLELGSASLGGGNLGH